jgi:glycosyltransferase involved in cell wall biosynthesis
MTMRVVVLTKRQYTNKDVIDDRYGRLWEIPMALAREGHDVTCLCLSYQPRSEAAETVTDGRGNSVRWISVNLGVSKLLGFLKYYFLSKKTIKDIRPDIVWSCSDTIYTVLGHHFSKRFKCSSVADLYDNFEYFGSYQVPILRSRFRKAVRESDGVSCVSESLSRHLAASYGRIKPTAVITNAVDSSVFRPMDKAECRRKLGLPQDAVLIGSAGDISNYRGADMMYRAFSDSAASLEGVHLAVAGYRTPDTQVPEAENIHDLGLLPPGDIPAFLNCLDLAVVYNRSSTFGDFCFPQKFYEMLACRIPIIAADVGELSHMLKHKPHLLYEDGNIDSLVSVIQRQLANRELLDFEIPSWTDQAALLQQLMQSVMSRN